MNEIRRKIWNLLADVKANECYSKLVLKRYQKYDRALNIFLVITTSSSVTAWAIWDHFGMVWGAIIAISQLLTLIKPSFLFQKYSRISCIISFVRGFVRKLVTPKSSALSLSLG